MSTDRQLDDRISRWLEAEAPPQLPDRVLRATFERTRKTRQQGRWQALLRRLLVNRMIFGLAAAAVVVVAVVLGAGLYFNNPGVGAPPPPPPTIAPTTAPTATAEPTATPSPVTNLPSWYTTSERPTGQGILSAGDYATRSFQPGFTFSVPDGWVNDTDSAGYFALFQDTPANQAQFARTDILAQGIVMGVHPSPYATCESAENNSGATAAEMATAIMASDVLAASEPIDVTIGGLTGKQVDVRRDPDWTGTCPEDSEFPAGLDPEDERLRMILLDVPGRGVLVIFLGSVYSASHETFLAEAMPIVESFQFSQ